MRSRRKVLNLTALVGVAVLLILIAIVYGARVFSTRSEQLASSAFEIGLAELKVSRRVRRPAGSGIEDSGDFWSPMTRLIWRHSTPRGMICMPEPARSGKPALCEAGSLSRSPSMDELRTVVERKFAELDETVALARQGRTAEAPRHRQGNLGLDLMGRARANRRRANWRAVDGSHAARRGDAGQCAGIWRC